MMNGIPVPDLRQRHPPANPPTSPHMLKAPGPAPTASQDEGLEDECPICTEPMNSKIVVVTKCSMYPSSLICAAGSSDYSRQC
jgi:hypothetical protein